MSHTPWHVEEERWRGVFSGKPFALYHVRSDTDLIAKVFSEEPDANLIAAAPELLELVKAWEEWEAAVIMEAGPNLLEWCSNDIYERMLELQVQRNDAVAKAEGRT